MSLADALGVSPNVVPVPDLGLADWAPRSQLRLEKTLVARAGIPAVDVHNHLGRWLTDDWCAPDVGALLALMDETNLMTMVNLDGLWGERLEANLERYDRAHPERFVTFCQIDWPLLAESDGVRRLTGQLRESASRGAQGVKVWKNLGLAVRDAKGSLVLPDDSRVVEILAVAGELGLPVLIHVADPVAFFEPLDARNERFDELAGQPTWSFADRSVYPSFFRLLEALESLVRATPGTTYIGAHVGCVAEDLAHVSRLLRELPNFVVDIAGRLAELGRQPRRFRQLLTEFPDRVLFGTDVFPLERGGLETYFRFLETGDESFEYAPGALVPPQGRWAISGADLPKELLTALYSSNARRILGLS
ncbi:amidohydrolase family protein [Oerskovia sp. Root22]|uniref:amidohydrolase family protein n=1 Tax=Oerskovia sp. Root22 TaxID=1736494 RepID=UPI0006F5F091|nr:amidohydrolase family protein [Oerskovia sp. Root22]KRC43023.1 amidohydrolase [Oerskovia sp. Root22]